MPQLDPLQLALGGTLFDHVERDAAVGAGPQVDAVEVLGGKARGVVRCGTPFAAKQRMLYGAAVGAGGAVGVVVFVPFINRHRRIGELYSCTKLKIALTLALTLLIRKSSNNSDDVFCAFSTDISSLSDK